MAGLVPAIYDLRRNSIILKEVVDDRHKGGHDGMKSALPLTMTVFESPASSLNLSFETPSRGRQRFR
jgi:hypothetical protein